MTKAGGGPDDESLSRAIDQLKRDGLAWAAAEEDLLRARLKSTLKRVELAALIGVAALMVTIAGTVTLADVAVQSLAASLGPITSGVVVSVALLVVGAFLIVWVKALLQPVGVKGRARSTVDVIWSALNEPN